MRIQLKRKLTPGNTQDTGSYMKSVFANVSHLIWLKSVQSTANASQGIFDASETIIIECTPQGIDTEDENLANVAAKAIASKNDLILEMITITPSIQRDAIEKKSDDLYEINEAFAHHVAIKPDYCQSVLEKDTLKVKLGYTKVGENRYRYNGRMETTTKDTEAKTVAFNSNNPYHCFAASVENNTTLQQILASGNIQKILMEKKPNNQTAIRVITSSMFMTNLPEAKAVATTQATTTTSNGNNVVALGTPAPATEKNDSDKSASKRFGSR